MIKSIARKRRIISFALLAIFSFQIIGTQTAYALTSGPTQPEVQGFQPAGTTDMVDLFTGDFSYNIPLFELPGPNGGYPFNLSYQSGITMDQEASWVGLGWSLTPGAITRQMRGLPDEFKGDPILTKTSVAPSVTVGLGAGLGLEAFGGSVAGNFGFSVRENSYKGLGYSIDANLGYSTSVGGGMTSRLGLNLSMDSQEGIGISPSLSLSGKIGEVGLHTAYNSKTGLSNLSLSGSLVKEQPKDKKKTGEFVSSQSASISLAHPGYTPQVTMPMKNIGLTAQIKLGTGWQGIFPSAYVKGFYSEQWLNNDKKYIQSNAYGYMNYQSSKGATDLLDINREKDGMVSQDNPNLAIPSLTYDIYSVSGQGIGAMYRPMRNDFGVVHDQQVSSVSIDAGYGGDLGPPLHFGGNYTLNHSKSTSGPWKDNNSFGSVQTFQDAFIDKPYEPWFFKVHGEPVPESGGLYDSLGGNNAVRVALTGFGNSTKAGATIENKAWNGSAVQSNAVNHLRKSRNHSIETITNGQLLSGSSEIVPLFKVQFLDNAGTPQTFDRSSLPQHHIAGITALNADGLRYNYAIPAYNTKQEEVSFTGLKPSLTTPVNRINTGNNGQEEPYYQYPSTDKFLKITKLPPYAHSYLLTSIVGPDYVDVTDDGVTPDDLGYWVKFTYQKMTTSANPYKWRDPYAQAHYQEGWKTDPRDDKGSYTYGEKELWYLQRAETKSHIATFSMQQRQDGYGVQQKLQDTNMQGSPVYALQEVNLFTRSAQNNYKIKTVKFDYDYSLCNGVFNNSTGGGKLTLKKVWFEYGSTSRGKLNPYNFTYHNSNPSYSLYAYDRWGMYKPYPETDPLQNIDGPYSLQDPLQKNQIDNNAASWNLSRIQLPSGGVIQVNYETDDYAYVQQQTAAQMMNIVSPSNSSSFNLNDKDLKVRFKLEQPIPVSSSVDTTKEVAKYLDLQQKQLYFKLLINLRSAGEGFYEYVSGYVDIDTSKKFGLEKDPTGQFYVNGYIYVKPEKGFHPFSLRAWQHLRTNQPELANSGSKLSQTSSNSDRIGQIRGLGSVLTQLKQMFQGFNKFCKNKGWGREVVAAKSWIKLSSPDKIKFGGGSRVRQITLTDQWAQNAEGIYGQVYEYTTQENNVTISSGVAAYEPIVGGEENSLHYAKKFTQTVPLRADNNFFFEYPINESCYPGPQVGYGKVTVTSLAAASLAGKTVANILLPDGRSLFPQGTNTSYGTTGMTIHEFFTAKDFPVITDETDKQDKPFTMNVIIPLLGSITASNLTTSQGYSIIVNDMHGKQKKTSNFRQDAHGKFDPQPISWVQYNYRTETVSNRNGKSFSIANAFKDNGDGTLSVPTAQEMSNAGMKKYAVGQETEFFTDMRQFEDVAWGGGVNVNVDGIFILFGVLPIPTAWPNINKNTQRLRSSVVNKIIFKSGIQQSVEAFDGGSHVTTTNIKWDKITGAPVLTSVTNDFNAPIYSYQIPAYTQYSGMGAAYKNVGMKLTISNVLKGIGNEYLFTSTTPNSLYPGDELLLYASQNLTSPLARVVFTGADSKGELTMNSSSTLSLKSYTAMIVRSGYRNQLNVMAGSMTGLQDPSIPGQKVVYNKTVTVPAR